MCYIYNALNQPIVIFPGVIKACTISTVASIFNFFDNIDTSYQPFCLKLVHILVAIVPWSMQKDFVQHRLEATRGNMSALKFAHKSPRRSDAARNPLAWTLEISQTICVPIFRQNGWFEVSILSKKLKIDYTTCTDFNDSLSIYNLGPDPFFMGFVQKMASETVAMASSLATKCKKMSFLFSSLLYSHFTWCNIQQLPFQTLLQLHSRNRVSIIKR